MSWLDTLDERRFFQYPRRFSAPASTRSSTAGKLNLDVISFDDA
jgi:hypothetical protein